MSDTFTRADNAATLGNAETGQPWTVPTAGAQWGVQAGRAYYSGVVPATPTQSIAVVDSGVADHIVNCDVILSAGSSDVGLVNRVTDDNNYYLAVLNKTSTLNRIFIFKKVAGTITQLATINPASLVAGVSNPTEFRAVGSSLTLKVAGSTLTATDTSLPNATRAGIRLYKGVSLDDGATTFDNFKVTKP